MDFADSIKLSLPDGTVAEIQMTQQLVESIRRTFSLSQDEKVTESHVKYFLVSGMKNALGAAL